MRLSRQAAGPIAVVTGGFHVAPLLTGEAEQRVAAHLAAKATQANDVSRPAALLALVYSIDRVAQFDLPAPMVCKPMTGRNPENSFH